MQQVSNVESKGHGRGVTMKNGRDGCQNEEVLTRMPTLSLEGIYSLVWLGCLVLDPPNTIAGMYTNHSGQDVSWQSTSLLQKPCGGTEISRETENNTGSTHADHFCDGLTLHIFAQSGAYFTLEHSYLFRLKKEEEKKRYCFWTLHRFSVIFRSRWQQDF